MEKTGSSKAGIQQYLNLKQKPENTLLTDSVVVTDHKDFPSLALEFGQVEGTIQTKPPPAMG